MDVNIDLNIMEDYMKNRIVFIFLILALAGGSLIANGSNEKVETEVNEEPTSGGTVFVSGWVGALFAVILSCASF